MRVAVLLAGTALLTACGGQPEAIDLDDVVAGWTGDYTVRAAKTEPTFIEQLHYGRKGDRFALDASSSDGFLARVVLELDASGGITPLECSVGTECEGPWSTGFLSTVSALAAHRSGGLRGAANVIEIAGRDAVCIPAEQLGADNPPLDPCFDVRTGAVLAHRHRSDGSLDGPTPDPRTIVVTDHADPALFEPNHH